MEADEEATKEEERSLGDLGETISGAAFMLGIGEGMERVAKEFRKLSGEAYAKGKDDRAKAFREAAELAEALAKQYAADCERFGYSKRRSEAFRELERRDQHQGGRKQ